MHNFSIAIIDSNVLAGMGLQHILEDIMPMADIHIFTSFEELETCQECFIHYFVASRIYFEHTLYFRHESRRTIVLVNGDMQINTMMTLNVCQSEKMLVKSILALHGRGHGPGHPGPIAGHPQTGATVSEKHDSDDADKNHAYISASCHIGGNVTNHTELSDTHPEQDAVVPQQPILSTREIEVAVLLSKGFINKEIADKLNISITTVITHRTHIMEKLHARSLADVIIYTVLNGFVEVGEL